MASPVAADSGRPFDRRVYAMVAHIPAGQLATYGQVAELIGAWGCARQVGWALRRLPLAQHRWHPPAALLPEAGSSCTKD